MPFSASFPLLGEWRRIQCNAAEPPHPVQSSHGSKSFQTSRWGVRGDAAGQALQSWVHACSCQPQGCLASVSPQQAEGPSSTDVKMGRHKWGREQGKGCINTQGKELRRKMAKQMLPVWQNISLQRALHPLLQIMTALSYTAAESESISA